MNLLLLHFVSFLIFLDFLLVDCFWVVEWMLAIKSTSIDCMWRAIIMSDNREKSTYMHSMHLTSDEWETFLSFSRNERIFDPVLV